MIPRETLRRALSPEDRQARDALRWFAHTAPTEAAFYLRFCRMPVEARGVLTARWKCDEWTALRRICSYFGIGRAPMRVC